MSWNTLYLLDLLALTHFATSYYRNCYRKGYRIDFWHAELFLACVLPTMIMLPFSRNELNGIIVGSDFAKVVVVLPQVFLISLLGYCAVLAGSSLWRLRAGLGVRRAAARVLNIAPDCSLMLMSSRSVLVFHTALCILLQWLILSIYFAGSGFGFDLRAYTFSHPALRPVAQFVSFYSILIASHALARYVDKKERVLLACTLCLTFGLVFFGARSGLLNIYLNVMLCYLVRLRSRVNLLQIAALGSFLIMVALYLGQARAGEYSLSQFLGILVGLVLFGDNFSDLRDFGWVYAKWDHVFWGGKTYLAAVTAFVPRFASAFRDKWGLGAATATTVGFDPHVHPGLRPGSFGEGFLNFGVPGVIVVGILAGFILRRMDTEAKRAFAPPHPSMRKAFASTMLIHVVGCITLSVNVSQLYVLGALYTFTWFCLSAQRMVHLYPRVLPEAE
jgi:oligosaccharide repeat unit polymerase